MVFRKVVEIIYPQKPGDRFTFWIQEYERGHPINQKYKLDLTKNEMKVFNITELLVNLYNVPEDVLGDFVKAVRQVYDDEMMEKMSRHVED
jgi:hypothetical protein